MLSPISVTRTEYEVFFLPLCYRDVDSCLGSNILVTFSRQGEIVFVLLPGENLGVCVKVKRGS